jgi:ketosteroid isomerase-like protein
VSYSIASAAMRDHSPVPNPTLGEFEAAFHAGQEAWNRGDFATAFAGLAPDCQYRPWDEFLNAGDVREGAERVLVGPEEVGRYFEEIFDTFPDFSNHAVRILEAAPGVFVVLNRARGTGRASGASVAVAHGGVWELQDGIVVRVREFPRWEEALTAAGLDSSIAAAARADGHSEDRN